MNLDAINLKFKPLAILFIVISLVAIYLAMQFPEQEALGPDFFPVIVSIGIIIFAIAELFKGDDIQFNLEDQNLTSPIIVFILLVAYTFLMPMTGFLVGTMVFLPILLYYSTVRSKVLLVLISVGFPILLFYIFSEIFHIRLPEGIIPVSRLLPNLPLGVI